jgi:hypothetical protein
LLLANCWAWKLSIDPSALGTCIFKWSSMCRPYSTLSDKMFSFYPVPVTAWGRHAK